MGLVRRYSSGVPRLTYSALVPPVARADLEERLQQTWQDLTVENAPESLCDMALAVVVVLAPVAREASPQWTADEWHTIVGDLIAQLLAASHRALYEKPDPFSTSDELMPGAPDFETFRHRVTDALGTSPAWRRYEATQRGLEPTLSATTRSLTRQEFPRRAKWLHDATQRAGHPTPRVGCTRWAVRITTRSRKSSRACV